MPLSGSFPPTRRIIVLHLSISYSPNLVLRLSIVAPVKVLTATSGFNSVVLIPFKIELPTSSVDLLPIGYLNFINDHINHVLLQTPVHARLLYCLNC